LIPASRKLILCIDDDEAILNYEKALLEGAGYAVMTASSAQQGLGLVTANDFDAVLIDYRMPDMNGGDAASEIKQKQPDLAVILLSGADVPSHNLAVADGFVHKLEVSRELLPMIARLSNRDRKPKLKQTKTSR
jgi:CheY-like chemotaxis protein